MNREIYNKVLPFLILLLLITGASEPVFGQDYWRSVINATGEEATGAVTTSEVTIGVEAVAESMDAPPEPPEYTTLISMYRPDYSGPFFIDVRAAGADTNLWLLDFDPRGNVGFPAISRCASLTWDPANFDPNGTYKLIAGMDVNGAVAVDDMFTTTSYELCGNSSSAFVVMYIAGGEICDPPVLSCPLPFDVSICAGETVCVDLTGISVNLDCNLTVSGNATLDGTNLCFTPLGGENIFTVTCTNDCGESSSCDVVVIVTITDPPVINCPPAFDVSVCAGEQVCVDIGDVGCNPTVSGNAVLNGTTLCFDPVEGQNIFFLTCANECGESRCDVVVNVTITDPPVISCPPVFDVSVCAGETVCIDIGDVGCNPTVSGNATLNGTTLCFDPVDGQNIFSLICANECGESSCEVIVNVTINEQPTAACFTSNVDYSVFPPNVCFTNCSNYSGNVEFEWDFGDGFISYDSDPCHDYLAEGTYSVTLTVTNECGSNSVSDLISIISPPVITCPGPFDVTTCVGEQVCVDIGDVGCNPSVIGNAVLNGTTLCFDPIEGQNIFTLTCTNEAGTSSCNVVVNVTITDPPVISCPPEFDVTICAGEQVCLDIGDIGCYPTVSGNATLNGTILCFDPVEGQNIFILTCTNECGESICDVIVNVTITDPPVITCPEPIDVSVCAGEQVCVDIGDVGCNPSVIGNAVLNGTTLCFDPVEGQNIFILTCTNECGESICDVIVNVTFGGAPVITCPSEPVNISICEAGEVCVPLGEMNCIPTIIGGATLNGSDLCFNADVSGPYTFTLTCSNSCGESSCEVTVIVEIGGPPFITCPQTPFDITVCAGEQACVDIGDVGCNPTVSGNATLDGTTLCFTPVAGQNLFTLTCTNECGTISCDVIVNVTIDSPPVIACPQGELSAGACVGEEVCVDLGDIGCNPTISESATLIDNILCFTPAQSGPYTFTLTCSNDCGTSTCEVVVDVYLHEAPTACFNSDVNNGEKPLEVCFTNCSNSTGNVEYLWDFGDGTTSTEFEPCHVYEEEGCYSVTLSVLDECGERVMSVENAVCVTCSMCLHPTTEWIAVFCGNPTLDGIPLNPGDIITAFDPDGVFCGIDTVAGDGIYGFMSIYADDIDPSIDEGAEPGDEITFKINGLEVITDPIVTWTQKGDVFELCNFTTVRCRTIELATGWNLISWNVEYVDQIVNMMNDNLDCIDVILGYNQGGVTFDPSLIQFSTLKSVDYHFGYWFRMNCDVTVELCGFPIDQNDNIAIYPGWNLVSYWPEEPMLVENALLSIIGNVQMVLGFDNGGLTWKPGEFFSRFADLTEMKPLLGYWIKSSGNDVLIYEGFDKAAKTVTSNIAANNDIIHSTREWVSVYGANITVDGTQLDNNSEIKLYSESGVLCGKGTYNNNLLKFTSAYGYDPDDLKSEGYPQAGENVIINVNGMEIEKRIIWETNGSRIELSELTTSLKLMPANYNLKQNYPNPFNPSTQIGFTIPKSGYVSITIFNVLGQNIRNLVNENYSEGSYEIHWDGNDDYGKIVSSGVYLYRIEVGDFVKTKKMTLMK